MKSTLLNTDTVKDKQRITARELNTQFDEESNSDTEKKTIIYISGEGHSGTTLLDAILGNQKYTFSSGELMFFAQKGIQNQEYCSCGNPVPHCEVWSKIIIDWEKRRVLSLERYIQIQNRITSLKNIVSSKFALKNPMGELAQFLDDTTTLYDTIFTVTGSKVIIDSSKAPGRILILRKLGFDLQVMHLIRRFGDVLNSFKKKTPKDLVNGVEHDIEPLNSSYVLSSWSAKNLLTYIFSKGVFYKKIKYEDLVANPVQELAVITNGDQEFSEKLNRRGPFYLKHLVAGNKFRMKDHVFISEKPMNTSYHRLSKRDRALAKIVDYFY